MKASICENTPMSFLRWQGSTVVSSVNPLADRSGPRRSNPRPGPASGPAYLYRVFAGDDLIYVGQTIRPWSRFAQHQRNSWWSVTATKTRLVVVPDVATALKWEKAAILDEVPRWNVSIPALANDVVFADFLQRWLINERNTRAWYRDRLNSEPIDIGGEGAHKRLLARYRVRHGREFDPAPHGLLYAS